MKPLPAFLLDAGEFLSVTTPLSLPATGALIRLVCWSWDNGPIPGDLGQLARICAVRTSAFRPLWTELAPLWRRSGRRSWVYPWLEARRRESRAYQKRQANAGRNSAQRRLNLRSTTVEPATKYDLDLELKGIDQPQDQDQDHAAASRRRIRVSDPNPGALHLMARDVVQTCPSSDWANELKDRAAKAGIAYDRPLSAVSDAIRSAEHHVFGKSSWG